MQNIIFLDNFLFVKLVSGIFLHFVVLLKDQCKKADKNSKRLQPVLAALQIHIEAWCMNRFYVKNF